MTQIQIFSLLKDLNVGVKRIDDKVSLALVSSVLFRLKLSFVFANLIIWNGICAVDVLNTTIETFVGLRLLIQSFVLFN